LKRARFIDPETCPIGRHQDGAVLQ
jgi:hypothetical protein